MPGNMWMAYKDVPWAAVRHLIALYKQHGVWPIGLGLGYLCATKFASTKHAKLCLLLTVGITCVAYLTST